MPWLGGDPRLTRQRSDSPSFPFYHSARKKPRRWPLVFRFIKGAIHGDIALPVLLHAAFAALVVYLDERKDGHLSLPSTTIPSLSIVVGLMLVFRNQTSYDRFWQGNTYLTTVLTNIRNLTRMFLTCSHHPSNPSTDADRADTERTVRILLALIFAAKNHLRAEWGQNLSLLTPNTEIHRVRRAETRLDNKPEYDSLLPPGTQGFQEQGLGLVLQLSLQIESYIKRGCERDWWQSSQASQMSAQLSSLVAAYGSMEMIHLTPLPIALLIHMRQVLALFCCVLPFGLVTEMGWWTVIMVVFVTFTLYGIDAIGVQLEDPFGYDKNDIKVDAIAEDLRVETGVLLEEWHRGGSMFSSP